MDDLRFAIRLLLKRPAFSAIIIVTLALGIGSNTAIFSAFNAVMLRPLPYHDPDSIATVWDSFPKLGVKKIGVTYANFADLKERSHAFDPLALYAAGSTTAFNLTGLAGPERVQAASATADFFRALGVNPIFGRTLTDDDAQPGRNRVVVLGYNLWQRDFGGDTGIVNRIIKLNDVDYMVIGVMPAGFSFPSGAEMPVGQQFASATELWVPLTIPNTPAARNDRQVRGYRAVARIKPGVTINQAEAETRAIAQQLVAEHPTENDGLDMSVTTMRENQIGEFRPAMFALLGAVGFTLLIACTNIANLLLSRATARRRELVIRAALGASRRRIVRQLLTESMLLSMLGGLFGILLSMSLRLFVAFAPANIPRLTEARLDLRVLLFTLGLSLLTGVLIGLVPALHASRLDLQESLKEGARGTTGSNQRWQSLLVGSEVALVFVLVIAAGLMLKSFHRLSDVAPGFQAAHVLTARVTLPAVSYPTQKKLLFYEQLIQSLNREPGESASAIVRDLPLSGTDPRYGVTVQGRADSVQGDGYTVRDRIISADYFKVLGIPLMRGRYFDSHDGPQAPAVAIINESAAARIFPGEDPLGHVLVNGGKYAPDNCTIVGIVGDVKFGGLDSEADPEVYVPYTQLPESFVQPGIGGVNLVVLTAGKSEDLVPAIRKQVSNLDQAVPVSSVMTMDDVLSASLAPRRFNMLLLSAFAIVALTLAAVGIYGVLSYWVAERTREIGIRTALGARTSDIFNLILSKGMTVVLVGLIFGAVAGFALARLLASAFVGILFGVRATDPATFISVALLLIVVAFIACFIPAYRAVKVDPTTALRNE